MAASHNAGGMPPTAWASTANANPHGHKLPDHQRRPVQLHDEEQQPDKEGLCREEIYDHRAGWHATGKQLPGLPKDPSAAGRTQKPQDDGEGQRAPSPIYSLDQPPPAPGPPKRTPPPP